MIVGMEALATAGGGQLEPKEAIVSMGVSGGYYSSFNDNTTDSTSSDAGYTGEYLNWAKVSGTTYSLTAIKSCWVLSKAPSEDFVFEKYEANDVVISSVNVNTGVRKTYLYVAFDG